MLARFNSTEDINFGAAGHPEIEPGLFLVGSQTKRFFTQADVRRLFAQGWQVQSIEHKVTYKYQAPKALWEVAVASAA